MMSGMMPGMMPGMPGAAFSFGGMPRVQVFHNGRPVNMGFQKVSPIVKTVEITLEQAYTGLNYPLKIEKWVMEGGVKKNGE
jgi:hypothetical protein